MAVMRNRTSLGAGNVEFVLDGERVVLKPTLYACQTISRRTGGLVEAVRRIGNLDVDEIIHVISLGLGHANGEDKDLGEKIFRTGVAEVALAAVKYLNAISNGGKAPAEKSQDGSGEPEEGDPLEAVGASRSRSTTTN